MGFRSMRENVLAYRFNQLRLLMFQAGEDAKAEGDAKRSRAFRRLEKAMSTLHGVMRRGFTSDGVEVDGSLTVGQYLASAGPEGSEEAGAAINEAAFALVDLE